MTFSEEVTDRLTVQDVKALERIMEIMAKFRVPLPTVISSVETIKPWDKRSFSKNGYADFMMALEAYNKLAENDGYQWTPPSERKKS